MSKKSLESSSAEDMALLKWENEPWPEGTDAGNPWGLLEESIEATRLRFVARYQEAFRAGFRAGQGHPRRPLQLGERADAAIHSQFRVLDRIQSLESKVLTLEAQTQGTASSPLGIELSKIRDMLNSLEAWHRGDVGDLQRRVEALENHPERLGSSEKHIDRRVEALEKQFQGVRALEKGANHG